MAQTNGNIPNPDNLPELASGAPLTSDAGLKQSLAQAERYVAQQDRIRKLALTVTSVTDWIDEGGKPYLQWSGSSKIARAFGVSYEIPAFEREHLSDEHGEYIEYSCAGMVSWNGQAVAEIGAASSRDSLFGVRKVDGEKIYLPLSEINAVDVKKKAMTNFLNRGLKSLIGLSFTWEEIEQITHGRISRSTVTGVAFSKGSKGGNTDSDDTKKLREEIRQMCLDMGNNDPKNAGDILAELSEWQTKDGEKKEGKRRVDYLSEKQVGIVHRKCKARHSDWQKTITEGYGEGEPNIK